MKKSANILMVSLLSLMIVFLSVGTTLTHCLRYNTVEVGVVADCCQNMQQDHSHSCCHQGTQTQQWKRHCMEYKQVKLSPTLSIQKAEFDATPLFAGIMPCCWSKFPPISWANVESGTETTRGSPPSPPRAYLTFIQVLQI